MIRLGTPEKIKQLLFLNAFVIAGILGWAAYTNNENNSINAYLNQGTYPLSGLTRESNVLPAGNYMVVEGKDVGVGAAYQAFSGVTQNSEQRVTVITGNTRVSARMEKIFDIDVEGHESFKVGQVAVSGLPGSQATIINSWTLADTTDQGAMEAHLRELGVSFAVKADHDGHTQEVSVIPKFPMDLTYDRKSKTTVVALDGRQGLTLLQIPKSLPAEAVLTFDQSVIQYKPGRASVYPLDVKGDYSLPRRVSAHVTRYMNNGAPFSVAEIDGVGYSQGESSVVTKASKLFPEKEIKTAEEKVEQDRSVMLEKLYGNRDALNRLQDAFGWVSIALLAAESFIFLRKFREAAKNVDNPFYQG